MIDFHELTYKDIAMMYADAGVSVFPCKSYDKSPLCRNGFKDATTDKKKIRRWWDSHPEALIAGVCDDQFTIVDVDLKNGGDAFASLGKVHKYIKNAPSVTTMSGGTHHYFKYDSEIGRKIGLINSIDILGKGGYTILPDDSRYCQTGSIENFIKTLRTGNLDSLNSSLSDHIKGVSELSEFSDVREHNKPTKRKAAETPVIPEDGEDEFRDEVAEAIEAEAMASHNKMYEKVGKNAGYEEFEFNGDPVEIKEKSMTTQKFNGIFHNKDVQKRIATFLGLPVPDLSSGKSSGFRSVLPSHNDDNPSMAARWTSRKDGGHSIIIRDFSDHYSNGKQDYNLTRLFMIQRYKKNYRKPSPTEFYVWSMRLLEDAGVISVKAPKFNGITKHLTEGQKKAAEGFLRLVGIKKLWKDGGDETCYSQKFAAAWTGVSTETVNKMKAKAIKFGIIEKTGNDHGEGPMRTPIFKLGLGAIIVEEIKTISEMIMAVNQQLRKKKEKTGKASRFNVSYNKSASKSNDPVTKGHTENADKNSETPEGFMRRRLKDIENAKSLNKLRMRVTVAREFEERFGISFKDFQMRGST